MAGLQQGKSDDGGNHDGNDDCALVCGDHDQKEVEWENLIASLPKARHKCIKVSVS